MFGSRDYDVIVIGAGPAGCTAASLVALGGRRVLLLEREAQPVFRIGESLMPETYRTFKRLGLLDEFKTSHFPKKYSVQFFSKSGKASAPFYFFEDNPHESSMTWQVLRSEFDQLLFENATRCGAGCHRQVNVKEVLFEGESARGVRVSTADGEEELASKVVVDASGQSALISKRTKLRHVDSSLNKASIYTHFEGGLRDPGIDEGATLILHTEEEESWFWYIPLPEDLVSVGVVGSVDYLIKERKTRPEETFYEEVEKCPEIKRRVAGARQARQIFVTRDFSYRSERIAGPGWVLAGDAFSFIDPIYSSGVFLALKSGEMAADSILEAFRKNDFSGKQLGSFGPELDSGMEAIRKLVYAFYTKDFSFSKFLKRFPEHKKGVVDILVGNVFGKDFSELFACMGEMSDLSGAGAGQAVEKRA